MAGRGNSRHCSMMLSNSSSVMCLLPRLSVSFGQKTHLALQQVGGLDGHQPGVYMRGSSVYLDARPTRWDSTGRACQLTRWML